jgi:hypothetical protein
MCDRVKPTAVNCAVVSHSLLHRLLLRLRTAFLPLVASLAFSLLPSLLASDGKIILTRYGSVPLRSFLVFASDLRSVLMPCVFFFFVGENSTVLDSQCLLFVDAFFVACKWRSSLVQAKSFQTGSVLFGCPLEHECAACFLGFFFLWSIWMHSLFNVLVHEYYDGSWL